MPTDPAAGRVAQIRAHYQADTLTAYWTWDAGQAANDVGLLLDALRAAETARDQAQERAADAMMAHGLAVESLRHVEAECKRDMAACEGHHRQLAALEAAARALAMWPLGCPEFVVALRDLKATLATPPEETRAVPAEPWAMCLRADANCEGELRGTPAGQLCGWHAAMLHHDEAP